jgi:hypothetical protein
MDDDGSEDIESGNGFDVPEPVDEMAGATHESPVPDSDRADFAPHPSEELRRDASDVAPGPAEEPRTDDIAPQQPEEPRPDDSAPKRPDSDDEVQ